MPPAPGPDFLARFRAPAPDPTPAPEAVPCAPASAPASASAVPAPAVPAPVDPAPAVPSFLASFAAAVLPASEPAPALEAPGAEKVPKNAAPEKDAEDVKKEVHPNNKKVKTNRRTKLPSAAAPWNPKYRKPEPTIADQTMEVIRQMATTPEGTVELVKWIQAETCRLSFAEFFKQAWKVIEKNTELVWNWHLQLMCNVLQAVFMDWLRTRTEKNYINVIRHLILNVPPRASKSTCVSVCFQAWAWLHAPGMRFICLSVNDDATYRDAIAMRTLVRSDWYTSTFNIKWDIRADQDAKGNYANTEGGNRISMASRSEIVGLGAECVAGDTMVSTEFGDMPIVELHEMFERGDPVPRVWSLDHASGRLELREVVATRKRSSRKTVLVGIGDGRELHCTPEHQVWTDLGYQPAALLPDRRVSVLRRPHSTIEDRKTATLPGLSLGNAHMRGVCREFHATRSRVRQARSTWSDRRTVLQQAVHDDRTDPPADHSSMSDVWGEFPAAFQEGDSAVLFAQVSCGGTTRTTSSVGEETVPGVWGGVPAQDIEADVLPTPVRRQSTFKADDVGRKLELLGAPVEVIRRWALGQPRPVDPRARRGLLRRVREKRRVERARVACAPHRPRSAEQCAREPDHALRRVSHEAPQVEGASVLFVDAPASRGRETCIDVYDIQVDGNHNFFANGILVHNCILLDDPNNPLKSESRIERDEVNNLWDTNQYNRVNNNVTSLRIGVQQRTHEEDWTGHVIAKQGHWSPENRDGWLQVVIPGEFDPERKFSMPEPLREILRKYLPPEQWVFEDPRTEPGEPIDNVRMPTSWLDGERERWRGTDNYAGQILQSPVSATGGKVQKQWWGWFRLAGGVREHIDELELGRPRPSMCHDGPAQVVHAKVQSPGNWDFDWIMISVDPAAKRTEKGSNYGMLVVAGKGGRRYVLDDRTQKGAFHEIIDILKEMIIYWEPDSILIEPKAAGPDIMDTLREQMAAGDLPMVTIEEAEPGNSDKEMRLEAALPYIKNGMVYLLDGAAWVDDFVAELSAFPRSQRDDRVDSLSQVLNHIRAEDDCWPSL